ncbi:MAG TPA: glucose-6-phosphate dehydrogenase, partial [Candidatus Binatus sp.]|nr:glucose-6-phosphate dehydrogenase [Candidatus Binatus sp.]
MGVTTANRPVDLNHLHPVKEQRHQYDPCILVIFGGAGDLSHRKLIPALYNLSIDGELPDRFAILGFSMEDLDDDKYRAFALSGIEQFSRRKVEKEHWEKFAPMLHFQRGTFTEAADYQNLRRRCEAIDSQHGTEGNRAFYFAIPPAFIDICSEGLTAGGMIHSPGRGHPFTRVVVEKPIGSDLASASEINAQLAQHFDESQIFRIDHYLGKETVENLMVLRFANAIFEPIWTARFVDHVQITVAEAEGVGTRAAYYDHAGALRDMVQNHMLQ